MKLTNNTIFEQNLIESFFIQSQYTSVAYMETLFRKKTKQDMICTRWCNLYVGHGESCWHLITKMMITKIIRNLEDKSI